MSRILRREIERSQTRRDSRFEPSKEKQLCIFVKVAGSFKVPNRPGFNYVQVITPEGDSPAFQVFNSKVQARANVKVWVGPGLSGRWEVLDWYNGEIPDIPGYSGGGYQLIHAPDLEWPDFRPGANAISIYPRAIVAARVYPGEAGGLTISVVPLRYVYGGQLVRFGGVNNYSIAASQPASGLARWVLVYLNPTTNTIGTTNGDTATDTPVTLPPDPIPPNGVFPLGLVRLDSDQTENTEADIEDWRPPFGEAITGPVNAPADAFYFVGAAADGLTNERVLTFDPDHFDEDDGGAGAAYTVQHAVITAGDLHTEYVRKATLTTKGDIYVLNASGVIVRLPVGVTGEVLTADGSQATGLRWTGGSNGAAGTRESFIDGTLTTATNVGMAHIVHESGEIVAVYIHCKTPGSAGSTIVDVNLNGTTIFTTQSNRPELAYDDADGVAKAAAVEIATVAEYDVLTTDIDQIATDAADLSILIVIGPPAPSSALLTETSEYLLTEAGDHLLLE